MTPNPWQTQEIGSAPRVVAPDGSAVHILCATARGSMIAFSLPPGAVSKAVAHKTVEEIWFVVSGSGRLWRGHADSDALVALAAGTSVTIPTGTRFQFRNDGGDLLQIVAVTMPPWPGSDEAELVDGCWPATV